MEKVKKHGGYRKGAGRKKGGGRYGEATKAMRIPVSAMAHIESFLEHYKNALTPEKMTEYHASGDVIDIMEADMMSATLERPVFLNAVPAGVPMTMDTHIDMALDLNQHFIEHPSATFYVRVAGMSMVGAGIYPDDILIVDRAIEPRHNKIVIASVDGDMTVKRLFHKNGCIELHPENPDFSVISFDDMSELSIWGVVTGVTRKL